MKLATRRRPTAEEIAAIAQAEDQRLRLAAQFARDQADADRAEQRRAEREQARADKRARKARAKARARRLAQLRRHAATARTVGPLLLVNAATVGGQLAYAHDQTPAGWHPAARIAVAVGVATAAESVALYVGWHAHDALLAGARTTAGRLRRASYGIALVMAAVNYSHFAGDGLLDPTALAVILGVLSSLSPWLWGLHTRRAQHVQLLREDLVDETGATFDPARRRAFPFRSWLARRWSIDHHVRDPRAAWEGYRAHRTAQRAAAPAGRIRAAWRTLLGRAPEPAQPEPAPEPEPAQPEPAPEPAPAPEPLSLDDPEMLFAARARLAMAEATARIRARADRLALVDREPAPAPVATALAAPVPAPAPIPEPRPAVEGPAAAGPAPEPRRRRPGWPPARPPRIRSLSRARRRPAREPERQATEPSPARRAAGGPRIDVSRLAAEYERLTHELKRKPKGDELGAAAGYSKATANRWMRDRRAQTPAQ